MEKINIAIIGSGSTYCPELIDGFIQKQSSLKIGSIAFMDLDNRKRTIVGSLCGRMLSHAGIQCKTIYTSDLDMALEGADFVVTQLRVGMLQARHLDETIPLKYGLIGQETTGIGGAFKALRTIPVIHEITKRMELHCKNAWLINFTNPSGIISDFVQNNTKVKSYGLCNIPINMFDEAKKDLGQTVDITYAGLNHLTWIPSIKQNGVEILPKALKNDELQHLLAEIDADDYPDFKTVFEKIKAIPSPYLRYFYITKLMLSEQQQADKSRAQVCMEVEENLLTEYSDLNLYAKPASIDKRGGHKYSLAATTLIDSIANDLYIPQAVNMKNNGMLPWLNDHDVVELVAKVGNQDAIPVPFDATLFNQSTVETMKAVKQYERLLVKASIEGSDKLALEALMSNPTIGGIAFEETVQLCYNEMKDAHRPYLKQFHN